MKTIEVKDIHRESENLELFLFNVGQGDHLMLRFPNMEYGLIDFFYTAVPGITEPPALTYFIALEAELREAFKKVTIAFLAISHTDADHIKGVCKLISWLDKHGVLIREFWLPAARHESQLIDFLQNNVRQQIDKLPIDQRVRFYPYLTSFDSDVGRFFQEFRRWQHREFECPRYRDPSEGIGKGALVSDIGLLRDPAPGCGAYRMGPLQTPHLDNYVQTQSLKRSLKMIGAESDPLYIDQNSISHILRIAFGGRNLFFGGDTSSNILEDCLRHYEDPGFRYVACFGGFRSQFVKVSHHGSRNSSSLFIWETLLDRKDEVYLGISAGKNAGYGHAHSETLEQIRVARPDAHILATNSCCDCVKRSIPQEYHAWYDRQTGRQPFYQDVNSDEGANADIYHALAESSADGTPPPRGPDTGLFAYIFDIPPDPVQPIQCRIALTGATRSGECLYRDHAVGLCPQCTP